MKKVKVVSAIAIGALWSFSALAENRVISLSDSERVAIFDEAGSHTFKVPANITGTARILVVGGGGGGGGFLGGGGGGGQVVSQDNVALTAGSVYNVTVGAGGASNAKDGSNGGASLFSGDSVSFVALGGGAGGGANNKPVNGNAGGNGGGAGGAGGSATGGLPTDATAGYPGGSSVKAESGWHLACGGGGGAGGPGEDGSLPEGTNKGGDGGLPVWVDITETSVGYGAGGGGGVMYPASTVGAQGGAKDGYGNAYYKNGSATQGQDGTGGGGGGGGYGDSLGARGGSGCVIIRYSFDASGFAADFDVAASSGFAPFNALFTASADVPEGVTPTLTWNFGDGTQTVVTTDLSVTHTYQGPGVYSVSLSVVAGGNTIEKSYENLVTVVSQAIYVNADSANPVAPYASEEDAAVTIADALAAVSMPGQTIRIMPGTYNVSYPISITNELSVEGMGVTPGDVVLQQPQGISWYNEEVDRARNIFTLNHAKAKVSNLTMQNGWHRMVNANPSAGGLIIGSAGGTVSNCVITGSINARGNHGAAGADLAGGLITHSIVEECAIDNPQLQYTPVHGGASAIRLTGAARAENCLIRNCNKNANVTDHFHAVLVNGTTAKAVNLTIVSCGSKPYTYQNSGEGTTPSCGLYVVAGQAVNCVIADVHENDESATNRAWGGAAANFINCATDTAEKINETCVTITSAAFKDFAAGNLIPKSGGPLVNAGAEVSSFTADMTDLAGGKRQTGRALDIGCYEGLPAGLAIIIR